MTYIPRGLPPATSLNYCKGPSKDSYLQQKTFQLNENKDTKPAMDYVANAMVQRCFEGADFDGAKVEILGKLEKTSLGTLKPVGVEVKITGKEKGKEAVYKEAAKVFKELFEKKVRFKGTATEISGESTIKYE